MPKRTVDSLGLAQLEAIRLVLRGGSVIDWHRLNLANEQEAHALINAQEFDLNHPVDHQRLITLQRTAVDYLRRNFEFPIPKPIEHAGIIELLMVASSKGHRQLCACSILKVMHIIHHLEARELLFMLPASDQQVFHWVEEKVYRTMGTMLSAGYPVAGFIGGRKNKDSLYTKLLSKPETTAVQIYDKLRFRVVMRSKDDVFPALAYLMKHLFPFNYVVPGESKNTLFDFHRYCEDHPRLRQLVPQLQLSPDVDRQPTTVDNRFTSSAYRIVHFVVDMPVRLPERSLLHAPQEAVALGRVIFVQTEFQITDQETERGNEKGDASHDAYKERQRIAVMRRLKLGLSGITPTSS